jgi:citrate lyase subunit beta/citryl-CoA lyase
MVRPQQAHPNAALYAGETVPPTISCCDHYAGTEKLIQKSLLLQALKGPIFDLTCDLEDGAGVGDEKKRRDTAIAAVCSAENKFGQVGIRISDLRSKAWKDDVRAIVRHAGKRVAHITIPKATGVKDVKSVLALIKQSCRSSKIRRTIPVHVLIETHGAVREAWEIAALPEVRSLDLGLMDFVSEHHGAIPSTAMYSPGQFEHPLIVRAKTELSAAAWRYGKVPTHNVTPQYDDVGRTKADAAIARDMFGFLRMWSIHPSQIDAIIEGFRPSFDEVNLGTEILLAAAQAGWAPISHRQKLHDRASYRYFWGILKRAHSSGMKLSHEATQAFFQQE